MRKVMLMAVVSSALALSTLSAAGMADAAGTTVSPIVAANNELGLAITGTNTNYEENVPAAYGPSDSETGVTPGFMLKGSYLGSVVGLSDVYAQIKYGRSTGTIAYKGALNNGNVYDGTDAMTTNRVTARLGMAFGIGRYLAVIPYLTGGIENWDRNLQGPYGYQEVYSSDLVGVGTKFDYALTPRLVLSSDVEYLAMLNGGMTPSNVPGIPNGILGSAHFKTTGEEVVGIDADYRIVGPLHVFGGVNYTHFDYSGGALNYGAFEPSSSTNLLGADLGVAYQF